MLSISPPQLLKDLKRYLQLEPLVVKELIRGTANHSHQQEESKRWKKSQ
jgi:hypothetical protein